MNKFLNSPLGSWLKVLIAVVLTLVLNELNNGHTIFDLPWKSVANAALMSIIPVLINWANPKDIRYGIKKKQ